jgi:hypothetical protein
LSGFGCVAGGLPLGGDGDVDRCDTFILRPTGQQLVALLTRTQVAT